VVAHRLRIDPERVERQQLRLASKALERERALKHVPRVEVEHARLGGALGTNQRGEASQSADLRQRPGRS
jgi:hypothetical protein